MLKDNLTKLGLTPNEAETYLYLVDNFKAKASEVAKYLEVTHPAAKKILDSLIGKRIVRAQEYGKTTYYFPETSAHILDYVKQQAEQVEIEQTKKLDIAEETTRLLNAQSTIAEGAKMDIKYLKGKEGIDYLVREYAKVEDKTIKEFFDPDLVIYSKSKDKADNKKILEENNISVEAIYTSSTKKYNPIVNINAAELTRDQAILPSAEMVIFDNKVAFLYITDDKNILVIENAWIANTLKTLFNNVKNNLNKKNKQAQ